MSTISVTPAQLCRAIARHPKEVIAGIRAGAQRGRTEIVQATPVDTGRMKSAWSTRMLLGGNVDVINDAPHAGIVERGARPHSVSEEGRMALRLWVKRNLGAELRLNMREQFGKVRRLDFEAQIDAIVWGICHKLRREGQKPRWIVRDRMPLLERMLKIEVERRLARVAAAGGAK